jgi:hypothetical protein
MGCMVLSQGAGNQGPELQLDMVPRVFMGGGCLG